ncbi:MAG: SRPBCC domain-containing protein [Actinomycetota bacterium]|nr:SRPBCC domain-containing protein [Actinomycetota bacterium]
MTVTTVLTDKEAKTLTLTAQFAAPIDRVWQLWADPRKLERWWGPPTYPATMVQHDLRAGGRVTYFMTGPEGDQHHGWWHVVRADAPTTIEFEDGFADNDGTPNPDMPVTTTRVTLDEHADGGTRMIVESTFPSDEALAQLVEMGMVEGLTEAMGQMDALLD